MQVELELTNRADPDNYYLRILDLPALPRKGDDVFFPDTKLAEYATVHGVDWELSGTDQAVKIKVYINIRSLTPEDIAELLARGWKRNEPPKGK